MPGRPSLLATTKQFLDDFNIKSLSELPKLEDLKDLDAMEKQLNLHIEIPMAANDSANDDAQDEADHVEEVVAEIETEETDIQLVEESETDEEIVEEMDAAEILESTTEVNTEIESESEVVEIPSVQDGAKETIVEQKD